MNTFFANLKVAALISIVTVLPFIMLEIIYRRMLPESFPINTNVNNSRNEVLKDWNESEKIFADAHVPHYT